MSYRLIRVLVISLVFGIVFSGNTFSFAGAATSQVAELKSVNPSEVCMVNNTVMSKPQIPVKVGEKTYYGCCEGCVGKLKTKKAMRLAKDPVTGRDVDKAVAFILKADDGTALYFESMEMAKKYIKNR